MMNRSIIILIQFFLLIGIIIAQGYRQAKIFDVQGTGEIAPGESENFTEHIYLTYDAYLFTVTGVKGTDANLVDVTLNSWYQITTMITANITISVDQNAQPGSTLSFTIVYQFNFMGGFGTVESSWTINVKVLKPVAEFTVNSNFGFVPFTARFSDMSKGAINSWAWDFGDGSTSTEQNPSHDYTTAGCYDVSLQVSGPDGDDILTKDKYITASIPSVFREIAADPVNDPLQSKVRDVLAGCDLDQDGKKELLVTDYTDGGKVHVYEFIADNTIEHVWSSLGTASSDPTPSRSISTGDLDDNGRQEILLAIGRDQNETDHGLHVFEWDGINDNGYGDGNPICCCPVIGDWTTGNTENIAVDDLDNDGREEFIYLNNGRSLHDGIFIYSCAGEFSLGNISWIEEAVFSRTNGDFSGSPVSIVCGDLDSDGYREAITSIYDDGAFFIIEATGTDQYTKRAYFKTTPGIDDFCIKDIILTDFDQDNKQDILFNLFNQGKIGLVHGISTLEELTDASYTSFIIDNIPSSYGLAYNDQDNDGNPNLYIAQGENGCLIDVEYAGAGDPTLQENYMVNHIFWDQDNLSQGSFAVNAPQVDLDGDNLKEIIVTFIEGVADPDKIWFRVFEIDPETKISQWQINTPATCVLMQNYPNPFNSLTRISFSLMHHEFVTLEVYNSLGQKVGTLLNRKLPPGSHNVEFDASTLPSGAYFYRIKAGDFSECKKMTLLQ